MNLCHLYKEGREFLPTLIWLYALRSAAYAALYESVFKFVECDIRDFVTKVRRVRIYHGSAVFNGYIERRGEVNIRLRRYVLWLPNNAAARNCRYNRTKRRAKTADARSEFLAEHLNEVNCLEHRLYDGEARRKHLRN